MLSKVHSALAAMHDTLARFELTGAEWRTLAVACVFALFFTLEVRFGYRKAKAKVKRQSYLANLGVFVVNDTLMSLMSVSSLLLVAEKYGHFGLLNFITEPAVKFLVVFVLFDLALYLWHRANHQFEALWMFHKVHHSDLCMNVTTAFRLHAVEVVFTTAIKAVFVVLMGVEAAMLAAIEAVMTLLVIFHHANIRFKGERVLGQAFIVPYLHRLHHSSLRREHDNNYGAVFTVWDWLFDTLVKKEPVAIGLDGVPGQGLWETIKFGLVREYWPTPATATGDPRLVMNMIAEAAYYRAEKRGFAVGYDYSDWLEAEKEINARLGKQKKCCSWACYG